MNEEWKPIKDYEDCYEISTMGRVKSLNYRNSGKKKIMKTPKSNCNYKIVALCKNGKYKCCTVHRLVAQAFIPNPYNLPQVNHKDENPSNNRVENLEWCDHKYNCNYGTVRQRIKDAGIKSVKQYTLSGEFIAIYRSASEVQRQLGYYSKYISRCCKGEQKTAYGYIWRYE